MPKRTGATAPERYEVNAKTIRKLIYEIDNGLVLHEQKFRTDGLRNWGYVGDLADIRDTLQDLADRLHVRGEYAEGE